MNSCAPRRRESTHSPTSAQNAGECGQAQMQMCRPRRWCIREVMVNPARFSFPAASITSIETKNDNVTWSAVRGDVTSTQIVHGVVIVGPRLPKQHSVVCGVVDLTQPFNA